jgi:hypothetical protein
MPIQIDLSNGSSATSPEFKTGFNYNQVTGRVDSMPVLKPTPNDIVGFAASVVQSISSAIATGDAPVNIAGLTSVSGGTGITITGSTSAYTVTLTTNAQASLELANTALQTSAAASFVLATLGDLPETDPAVAGELYWNNDILTRSTGA